MFFLLCKNFINIYLLHKVNKGSCHFFSSGIINLTNCENLATLSNDVKTQFDTTTISSKIFADHQKYYFCTEMLKIVSQNVNSK